MKKKRRVAIELFIEDGKSKVQMQGSHRVTNSKNIIEFFDQLRKNKLIEKSKKIKKENFIEYVYDVKEIEEEYSIVVRINNDEKDIHYEMIKYLDSISDLSITLKKANRTRIIAGLALGGLILVTAGPSIAKGLIEADEAYNKYEQQRYEELVRKSMEYERYYPTEEEKKQAEEDYYENLKKQALEGDEEARKEYENYYFEKMYLEQIQLEETEENYKSY